MRVCAEEHCSRPRGILPDLQEWPHGLGLASADAEGFGLRIRNVVRGSRRLSGTGLNWRPSNEGTVRAACDRGAAPGKSSRLTKAHELINQGLIETHREQLVAHGFPAANEHG
jgi:hypothetical protein